MTTELETSRLYTDFQGLSKLRQTAQTRSPEAAKGVAKEFESMFIQMMLKSMRQTQFGEGLLDSESTRFYRDLFDNQIALELAEKGEFGLAKVLARHIDQMGSGGQGDQDGVNDHAQLSSVKRFRRVYGNAQNFVPETRVGFIDKSARWQDEELPIRSHDEFISRLRPYAERAAKALGVNADMLLAQAALETGWGKHMIRRQDGANSHNLFGIKADKSWPGDRIVVSSLEYGEGLARQIRSPFRAYASYEESFKDYVEFISTNPRYSHALKNVRDPKVYVNELQKAGYATDPDYARKIIGIFNKNKQVSLKNSPNES